MDQNQATITIPKDALTSIYNMLYSISTDGTHRRTLALVEQMIEGFLQPVQDEVS